MIALLLVAWFVASLCVALGYYFGRRVTQIDADERSVDAFERRRRSIEEAARRARIESR